MSQALVRDLAIGCGCFGGTGGSISWLDLARDLPLLGAGLYLAIRRDGPWRLDRFLLSGQAKPADGERGPSGPPCSPQSGRRGWLRLAIPMAIIVAVIVAAVGVSALTAGGGTANQGVSVAGPSRSQPFAGGSNLPQFTAPALGGGQISWASYRGGPTVLILWAPWCAECERELPIVNAVARQFPSVRLTSIVTAVGQEPGPTPAQYMRLHGYAFPVALDSTGQKLADAFGLTGYPLIYYVYGDGTVARATIGVAPANVVHTLMAQIAG
jgi:thiol-disulfide isomerase/thioredoxin